MVLLLLLPPYLKGVTTLFCGWGHFPDCRCRVCHVLSRTGGWRPKRKSRGRKKPKKGDLGSMAIKKPTGNGSGKTDLPFKRSEFADTYPTLWEWLTLDTYADGTTRLTASLTIFNQWGVLKCCVNDRDLDRSAFFTGETVESLLASVDKGLEEDSCDWRKKPGTAKSSGQPPY